MISFIYRFVYHYFLYKLWDFLVFLTVMILFIGVILVLENRVFSIQLLSCFIFCQA